MAPENDKSTFISSYGQDLKIIHFIGAAKPWLQHFNFESRTVDAPNHIQGLLQLWWDIFVNQVHVQLDTSMVSLTNTLQHYIYCQIEQFKILI